MLLPLLSICIPTYNRSQYLKKTIDSIICQEEFKSENVEIVISDNCSTDDTEIVCKKYTEQYENIKYFKNQENVRDRNFPLVLSKGSGVLLKLCNDTLIFNKDALNDLLHLIRNCQDEKPVIFTSNNSQYPNEITVKSLEDFLNTISFNITWIGGLSIWKEDFNSFGNTYEGCDESLWQVPCLLKYVHTKKNAVVYNKRLFTTQIVEKKNISYGLYKVFYTNYLGFVKKYINNGISKACFDWLEKDLLLNFFPYWMVQYKLQNNQLEYSKSEDLIQCVKEAYKSKPYYKKFLRLYIFTFLKIYVKKILHR